MKKAGIVVAVTAASLLAVSPLAFAGDTGDHGYGRGGNSPSQVNHLDRDRDSEQAGLINVGDINALNDVNVCPGVAASVGIGNLLGLLGTGIAGTEADADDITCVNDDSVTQVNNR